MASGTKIRSFHRLLDASGAPLWAIGPSGHLVFLSVGCADWLGVDVESLLDRRCVAGVPVSDQPLDHIAASLSPPPGLIHRGTASLRIQPPAIGDHRPEQIEARFVRVGDAESALTIGVAGNFDDRLIDTELQDAVALRQRLDSWRKRSANLATIATAGVSDAARRLRRRLQVASSTRTDLGFFGPAGSGFEAVAIRVHELSASDEPLVSVDGPLMDAELLDATLMPLVHHLNESRTATATTLVRGLDEMPSDAQHRLVSLWSTFSGRLRLIALCGDRPQVLKESLDELTDADLVDPDTGSASGICPELIETISGLTVVSHPLASRVEDIPLLATAMLDARHAAGEGTAERLSRAALDALVIYPWPRNHDELDEAIRHAVRTCSGPSIAVEHLPLAIRSYRPGDTAATASTIVSLDDAVQKYEARLIRETLSTVDGNRSEAARRLGISRARLLRKLDEAERRQGDRGSGDETWF